MTDQEKAVATLTRCGPYSRVAATAFVETLNDAERAELVALHDQHAVDPERTQGGRFSDLLDNVANRQAKAAATGERSPDNLPDTDPGTVVPSGGE